MSRFLAFALPVSSVDDARECIALYANEYHDARHVCWAYMIGADRLTFLSSDNGEPSGTAGKPILGQINSLGLTNVVVIVVRYFGGIKLGTSGLIVAYREAARMALDDAGDEDEKEEVAGYTFCINKDLLSQIKSAEIDLTPLGFAVEPEVPLPAGSGGGCGGCCGGCGSN